jgi:hypothetical protein
MIFLEFPRYGRHIQTHIYVSQAQLHIVEVWTVHHKEIIGLNGSCKHIALWSFVVLIRVAVHIGAESFLLSGNVMALLENFCQKFNVMGSQYQRNAKYARKYFEYEEMFTDFSFICEFFFIIHQIYR